jgi:hypothetical protein
MEERGDTLAEALMNLMNLMTALDAAAPQDHVLHADYVVRAADSDPFWSAVRRNRVELVRGMTALAFEQGRPDGSDLLDVAARALRAAQRVHGARADETNASVDDYRRYVRAWLDDADCWSAHLDGASVGRVPDRLGEVLAVAAGRRSASGGVREAVTPSVEDVSSSAR